MSDPRSRLLGLLTRPRARAGSAVLLGTIAGAVASLLAAVVAARYLSVPGFAAFGVGMAVNSLTMQFADLGLATVAMVEVAEADNPRETRRRLVRLGMRRLGTAIGIAAAVAVVVFVLPSLEEYREEALIAAGGGALGTMAMFLVGLLQALRRFQGAGSVQLALGLGRLGLVGAVAVAGMGDSAMMVAYAALAPIVAIVTGLCFLSGGLDESVDPVAEGAEIELMREEARDPGRHRAIALIAIFSALLLNGDVLLLTAIGSAHEVAVYAAAWRIAAGALLLNAAFSSAMTPFVLAAVDAWSEARKLIRIGLAAMAGWMVLVAPITFVGVRVLGDIGDDAAVPLAILMAAFAIDGLFYCVQLIYYRVRRERYLALILGVEFLTMALVTLAFRSEGELAPAFGQLAARVVAVAMVLAPLMAEKAGRGRWFDRQG